MWQAVKSLYIPNYDLEGLQLTILIILFLYLCY